MCIYVLNFYTSNKLRILYPVIIQRVCFISTFLLSIGISNVHKICFKTCLHLWKYTCWSTEMDCAVYGISAIQPLARNSMMSSIYIVMVWIWRKPISDEFVPAYRHNNDANAICNRLLRWLLCLGRSAWLVHKSWSFLLFTYITA